MRRACLILLWLPLLTSGCLTHRLWTDDGFDEWNGPANPPNLRLYHDAQRADTLVIYDEYSDRKETTRIRAYFLNQNLKAEAQHVQPHFVNAKISNAMTPIHVLAENQTNTSALFFAVTKPGTNGFMMFTNGAFAGWHQLPTYVDGVGRMEKIVWTPLAVTADLTVIGGCVGVICLYAYADCWNLSGFCTP